MATHTKRMERQIEIPSGRRRLSGILEAIRRCHQVLALNHDRVLTTILIDDRRSGPRSARGVFPG